VKARVRKKRVAAWERYKRIMRKRCLDSHVPVQWSWVLGFYRLWLVDESGIAHAARPSEFASNLVAATDRRQP